MSRILRAALCALCGIVWGFCAPGLAKPVVPGTGVKVEQVGDDFEDPEWRYIMNGRKASHEQDEQQRPPGGLSTNGRWYESAKRGQPDIVRRIATPPGGLIGSRGSLFVCTRFSGVPGEIADAQMQDDLLMGIASRLGKPISVAWQPSVVVRVYLPEFNRWENRSGSSFGIRTDVRGRNPDGSVEPYWPGMFILFRSETSAKYDHDFAQVTVRARNNGADVPGPEITEPGWWTFGMSFTPDGQVHQYAHAGTEDLTAADLLYSSHPYGMKALVLDNFFIDVANREDGETWSTPWVIDDPAVYVIPPEGMTVADLSKAKSASGDLSRQRPTAQAALGRFIGSLQRR